MIHRSLPCLLATVLLGNAATAATKVTHYPPPTAVPAGAAAPNKPAVFSSAVLAGDTLYLSGTTDMDPATGKPPADVAAGARLVLGNIKRTLAGAGMTMDDLVQVTIYASDLADYATFNEEYRTFFTGPLPARAFLGAGSLLGGAHFEVMGIAVRRR